ncbi:DUF3052 family protein [Sphingomonas sp. M1-B02]|uniref:DUF3052 family protein n=1 Tax=Sphingomonas sp. M1-B02 TaxID=3114300 RepID=UPI00223EF3FD|nr:DUF3052 family protein [Sphingomonas sp. S6-11]UZK66141.1 DUF3052 family protein [Sphingomonas sp. S6-11]
MTAGPPGTPLAQTLGLKRGMRCWFHNMPDGVRGAIDPEAMGVEEQPTASDGLQCALLFVTNRGKLERELAALRPLLATNGFVWIAWPSQIAASDLSAEIVRDVAEPSGLADDMAYALDENWSALKLVIRKDTR